MDGVKYYGIDGQEISQAEAMVLFAEGDEGRRVAVDEIGDVQVSTVLLVFDHGFGHTEQPVLFETMIFGGEHDQEQWHYRTKEEALEGHREAVALVKSEGV